MTWIVATLIILFVLFIFIFVSNVVGKSKDVSDYVVSVGFSDDKVDVERVSSKTDFAFELNSENRGVIEKWLN